MVLVSINSESSVVSWCSTCWHHTLSHHWPNHNQEHNWDSKESARSILHRLFKNIWMVDEVQKYMFMTKDWCASSWRGWKSSDVQQQQQPQSKPSLFKFYLPEIPPLVPWHLSSQNKKTYELFNLKLFTILKVKVRSQNIKITSLMHKGMQGPWIPRGNINAVEHSLSDQRQGGRCNDPPYPTLCLLKIRVWIGNRLQFPPSSRALDQFSHILITISTSNWVLWNRILYPKVNFLWPKNCLKFSM